MSMLRLRPCALLLVLIVLMGGCSGPTQLPRQPMEAPPSIDGSIGEWDDRFTQVEDRSVSVAALPTDSLLYVALLVQDRGLVQSVAMNGLIVWVDPSGGQRRSYGVQYPLGIRRQRAGQTQPGGSSPSAASFDQVSLTELEVVRGDTSRLRIPARFSSGLRGKATLDPASLIYELAIPVGSSTGSDTTAERNGLHTSLSSSVGLGLEIPQPEEDVNFSSGGQGMGSVTGRGRRGRRGHARQRRQRQQSNSPQLPSLDLWMTVASRDGGQ